MKVNLRLNGKVAIVTGAGKKGEVDGTGYATSILFAREGAKVLLADLSPENANATLAEIEAEGGEASIFIGDVSTEDACAGMVEAAVERFGKVNVLFNNVGLGGSGTVTQVDAGEVGQSHGCQSQKHDSGVQACRATDG